MRTRAAEIFNTKGVVAGLIDRIKDLIEKTEAETQAEAIPGPVSKGAG